MGETQPQELAEIERRARRRWKALLLAMAPFAVTLGLLGGYVGSRLHSRRPAVHHHHSSTAAIIIALAILLVTIAAGAIFFVMMHRKHEGLFGPQLVMGLPYRQRRRVMKAVRRGEPPTDPTLRAVGASLAQRLNRYAKLSFWGLGIGAVTDGINAFLPDRPLGWRIFFVVGALILAALIPYQRRNLAGARRYLCAESGIADEQPVDLA